MAATGALIRWGYSGKNLILILTVLHNVSASHKTAFVRELVLRAEVGSVKNTTSDRYISLGLPGLKALKSRINQPIFQ